MTRYELERMLKKHEERKAHKPYTNLEIARLARIFLREPTRYKKAA